MITEDAHKKVEQFNKLGLHYNLVATAVYDFRATIDDPFSEQYIPYITAGLVSFDMSRMMGSNYRSKYDIEAGGFATRLKRKLEMIKPYISHLVNAKINELDIAPEADNIKSAYTILSSAGKDGLNKRGNKIHFYVGASKILHFINPYAFIIVDSNAVRAFKTSHGVSFRKYSSPGYSGDRYVECLEFAQQDIIDYGVDKFSAIEADTPITRIYDKLTFVTGSEILRRRKKL